MADPTAAQRRLLAKMGLAMPDGSFYIRNGTVGASDLDNAIHAVGRGESDGTDGDVIRKFIIKRAAKLNLSSKIPDTWNPDGSLKHDWIAEVEDYLSHYGVQGMHWRSVAERTAAQNTATAAGQKAVQAAKGAKNKTPHDLHLLHLAHLLKMSKDLAAAHATNVANLKKTGQTSKVAAATTAHAAAQAAIAKLALQSAPPTTKPATTHDAFDEEFLAHFGVKGMHWGVRRPRGTASSDHPGSPDHLRAKATMDTIKKHGVGAVSTTDLQHLVSRQNLEQQHGKLNPEHVNAGRKAVQDILLQVGKEQAKVLVTKAASEGIKKLTEAKN